jgi:hypothetical protein
VTVADRRGDLVLADAMEVVEASPAMVEVHDKAGWLALFARYHVLEDPVGSRPVVGGLYDRRSGRRGDAPLSRFWDTFIAANEVRFEVERDFVEGDRVVRDVTIRIGFPSGAEITTPAHLLYELVEEDGQTKIRRMAAHWEVVPSFAQLMRPSRSHLAAGIASGGRMLRHLGMGGTARFAGAVASVGRRGKEAVADLTARASSGAPEALGILGGAVPEELHKVIASGDAVTASCSVGGAPAVLIATLDRRSFQVSSARVYGTPGPAGQRSS